MPPSNIYLHRSRFVDYTPPSITALAFSHPSISRNSPVPPTLRLALGRSNGDIEIWNPLKGKWIHESTLKGGKERSIEGLAWTQDVPDEGSSLRLFSIGYSSVVTEWDLESGRPRKHVDCNGGVIWSIAAQPRIDHYVDGTAFKGEEIPQDGLSQKLVVGREDGAVSVLSTAGGPGELNYVGALMKPSAKGRVRVLSIAWQNSDTVIGGMSDGTIYVWDLRTGSIVARMSLGRDRQGNNRREVLVWALKVLNSGGPNGKRRDIVSGDSRGEISFWDGATYTLRQRIAAHEADVLTLETNAQGGVVVSSGVDRKTKFFGFQAGIERWGEIGGRRYHSHDVRAMAAWEGGGMSFVVSGGIDMTPIIIPLQNFRTERHRVIEAVPQRPIVATVPESRLLMSWYDREVKIWKVDSLKESLNYSLDVSGRKLLSRIVLADDENITSAHLTPLGNGAHGHILAISTIAQIKLFLLRPPRPNSYTHSLRVSKIDVPSILTVAKPQAKRVNGLIEDAEDEGSEDEEIELDSMGARSLQFSPDGKWLLVISQDSKIFLFGIDYIVAGDGKKRVSVSLKSTAFIMERIPRTYANQVDSGSEKRPEKSKKKLDFGTLGQYPRTITRIAFSSDSRIFVVGDLSGYLESYLLVTNGDGKKDKEEIWVSNPSSRILPRLNGIIAAIEFRPGVTYSSPPPSLSSLPTDLIFTQSHKLLQHRRSASITSDDVSCASRSGVISPAQEKLWQLHQQRLTSNAGEDRLMVLTAEPTSQSLYEFYILKGRLTEWARENTPEKLPQRFRDLLDVGSGIVWEVEKSDKPSEPKGFGKERIWVWGPSWIWMFDLKQGFPELAPPPEPTRLKGEKRKRGHKTSGAGGRITDKEREIVSSGGDIRTEISRKTMKDVDVDMVDANIADVTKEWGKEQADEEDDDDDDDDDDRWGKYRRKNNAMDLDGDGFDLHTTASKMMNSIAGSGRKILSNKSKRGHHKTKTDEDEEGISNKLDHTDNDIHTANINYKSIITAPTWENYKYRPIMAFLPVGKFFPKVLSTGTNECVVDEEERSPSDMYSSDGFCSPSYDYQEGFEGETDRRKREGRWTTREIVVVERPSWDIQLPPRFYGKKERSKAGREVVWE